MMMNIMFGDLYVGVDGTGEKARHARSEAGTLKSVDVCGSVVTFTDRWVGHQGRHLNQQQ
jgi:hypothetical protein